MNMPVDVNATFNTIGKIKPNYIRIEDEEHVLRTYKVESIEYVKEEKFAGINTITFVCNVLVDDCLEKIKIYYNIDTHKWMLGK